MLKTLAEKVNPKHAALIVVDMQNDFCHEDGVIARQGRNMSFKKAMAPRLVRLINHARRAGTPVIFIRQTNFLQIFSEAASEQRSRIQPKTKDMICARGSWGADFYAVKPKPSEIIIDKHRYSAFADTDFDVILRSTGIRTLIMTGVATNVCVETTARDGFMKDYYIVFVSDCTATSNGEDHEATLRNISTYFGIVASSDEIAAAWK